MLKMNMFDKSCDHKNASMLFRTTKKLSSDYAIRYYVKYNKIEMERN
jgi:hypothetical protein